jgi:hypothetical protein
MQAPYAQLENKHMTPPLIPTPDSTFRFLRGSNDDHSMVDALNLENHIFLKSITTYNRIMKRCMFYKPFVPF